MSWRRAGFISERLIEVLIPVCVYGMLASLVLHLIDLRSVFLGGGEGKLREASLAFAACTVLLERLTYFEGPRIARAYKIAVFLTITLFAITFTKHLLPFLVAEALFAVLWFAGHQLSKACSVNDDKVVDQAAESGIMGTMRLKLVEKLWTEKLATRHPGRVLLYFSLLALPLFSLGLILFEPASVSMLRLSFTFFLYLWCALALLFLSSLRQLAVYFSKRDVSLPDVIGLPWLALGFFGVTLALVLAFLLPQPPSPASAPVRAQILDSYKVMDDRWGPRKSAQKDGQGKKGHWSKENIHEFENRYKNVDQMNDKALSEAARTSGFEQDARNMAALDAAVHDTVVDAFRFLMRVAIALGAVGAVVAFFITLVMLFRRLREGTIDAVDRAKKWFIRGSGKKKAAAPATRRFPSFRDPFSDPARRADRAALVRYLWEAFLAYCSDAGAPCEASQTPLEFVDKPPEALQGFERQARFIARLFTFSEFSAQAIPETALPELEHFWVELQARAATQ